VREGDRVEEGERRKGKYKYMDWDRNEFTQIHRQ
jgi:hypothetical protein